MSSLTMTSPASLARLWLLAFLVFEVPPAAAIRNGVLDGDGHPYVGLMIAQDADGFPIRSCSGTLLSSRLFLTAGHCAAAPATHVEIWFDADVQSGIPANGFPLIGNVGGTPYTHPQYDPAAYSLHDLGVVVLDEPLERTAYGVLPELDVLDRLAERRGTENVRFTAVGYGAQKSFPSHALFLANNVLVRMVAHPRLVQINAPGYTGDFSLLLSNNRATGGTCFGDSGGPNFISSSNVVAGVTSFANNDLCAGTGGVYRVDRSDDLTWLTEEFGDLLP